MAVTPDTIPVTTQTRVLHIPDDYLIIGAVYGALLALAEPDYWHQVGAGSVTPDEMAQAMLEMIFTSAETGAVDCGGA